MSHNAIPRDAAPRGSVPPRAAKSLALVSLPATDSPEALPLGAACIAAAIGQSGALRGEAEAFVLEGLVGEGPAELASRIAASGAEWAGFSVYAWSRRASCDAARELRRRAGSGRAPVLVFAGGPEATADPERLLEEGGFDFVVVGEGETAAVEALKAVVEAGGPGPAGSPLGERLRARLAAIPGIAVPGRPFRRAGAEDPALLPSPWLSGALDAAGSGGDLVWELARGCPYRCAYCYESKGEPGVRRFPIERVEAELDLFVRSGTRYIFVLDPTFNADSARARRLLALFAKRAPEVRWKFELRAELLDAETARALARLDCTLQIGLQSARAETLALVGRGFDRKAFARGLGLLDKAGLSFGLDLIYGLPGDSLGDFEASLDWALGFGPNHLDVFPLALLPGTALADRAAELGLEAAAEPPYLARSTPRMPQADLERASRLAAACDRFYSAGRAVGWFRAALEPLGERSSAFLLRYADWLVGRGAAAVLGEAARDGRSPTQKAIESEQLAFLERSYSSAGRERFWPALRDLVRLHGSLSRAMAEGEETELELSYDPAETLGAASVGLRRFVASAHARPGLARVVPDAREGARIVRAGSRRGGDRPRR